MTKRKIAWTIIALVLTIAVGGILWAASSDLDVVLTQAQLQQKVDAKLPFSAKGVTVSKAEVDLSGDKIGLKLDASGTHFKTTFAGSAESKGTVRYDSTRGAFYFSPEELKVSNLKVNDSTVTDKLDHLLDKLGSPRVQAGKDAIVAKTEAVISDLIQSVASATLERVPVYTLKGDFKGIVVKAMLTSVEVKDSKVHAHLSIWQLTVTVAIYIFAFVLALAFAFALLASPGWGLAPLLLLS